MRSITVQELKAAMDAGEVGLTTDADDAGTTEAKAVLVDVREPYEFVQGHVPGAELAPMQTVPGLVPSLPTDRPVYLVCATGNRSGQVAGYLEGFGIDAVNVEGGTADWLRAGYPVER
jgi:rhodanese-related sulfurtransferase